MRAAGCTSRALLPNEARAPRRLKDVGGWWESTRHGATAPQAGGRLLEHVCPVEAFFIVPRSVAGGFPADELLSRASWRPGGCPALPGLPAGPAITGETTSTPRASPVQLYAWIRVPERPAMASAALLSNPMTQVRPGWLSANLMAALTFGSMEPLPNCPSSR